MSMAKLCGAASVSILIACLLVGSVILVEAGVAARSANGDVTVNSVAQLAEMTRCTTGLGLLSVERYYNWYGCYCGLGGGGRPLDATDTCCYHHDNCYERSPCRPAALSYTIISRYRMSGCRTNYPRITCARASSYNPLLYLGNKDCAEAICKCDRDIALCFMANRPTYHGRYQDWNRSRC